MRLEDLKYEFPEMSEEMRAMIEREVEKQVKTERPQFQKSHRAVGRTAAASIAAVLLLGTTVFAGVSIYRLQREPVGDHGVSVTISEDGRTAASTEAEGTSSSGAPQEVPGVKMEAGYLPEGMVETENGKYSFENAMYKGGVSITFYRMDTGDSQFEMLHHDVVSSEDITVNGYQGVYLEFPHLYEEEITFNQRIYVAYTDVHHVMEMYVASDVSKEEALKIAEGIKLTPTKDTQGEDLVADWDWSSYLKSREENAQSQTEDIESRITVPKEEMKQTHSIGERFSAEKTGLDQYKGLAVTVADVRVSDDLSLLNETFIDEELKAQAGADGKLLPATIQYIKEGGIDSLSEVVSSREVPQKLVYATVEYTNTGDTELSEVLFFGSLTRIREKDGKMRITTSEMYEEPAEGDTWTRAVNRGFAYWEMPYYDVHGGERDNNYIPSIKPGETVTVHMGWIVTEEELKDLYLNLDTFGGAYEFSDTSLQMGYVDIRQ